MRLGLPKKLKKQLPRILVGLLLVGVFLAHSAGMIRLPYLQQIELSLYDTRLGLTAPGGVDPRIVIIDIDEASLREKENGGEGRWPWSRDRMAELLDRAFNQYGVVMLGFDVVFAEQDKSSGIGTLEQLARNELASNFAYRQALEKLKPQLDFDDRFAQAMRERPVVLGFTFLAGENDQPAPRKGGLPAPTLTTQTLPLSASAVSQWQGYAANLDQLSLAASASGSFNPVIDVDGSVRRLPMLSVYNGGYYESLPLAMARVLVGGDPIKLVIAPETKIETFGALEWIEVGGMDIPVDEEIAALIPYRGPFKSFEYVSAASVIAGTADPKSLEGKIALVGTSAAGLLDLRTTPMGAAYPGVEIHANMIAGILDGTIKEKPPYAIGIDVLQVLVFGVLLAVLLPIMGPVWSTVLGLLFLAAAIGLNIFAFTSLNLVLPLAALLLTISVIYLFNMAYGFFFESRIKRQITGLFGQYVPPELVNEMAKDPTNYSMEGESRDLTILFSDVRGFTTISESLKPKDLAQLMNGFLSPFSQVIYEQRGTIDKYMGDCIMAFWGAPVTDPDHARHGVQAAFAMLKALEKINADFKSKGWPEIQIGVGLNTGKVSVGNMGSKIRLAYTVMGDAVNLASRLEGITKEYGAKIVIGQATKDQIPDLVCRELDRVRVKGKDVAVTIFEPLGFDSEVNEETQSLIESFHKALGLYRAQQWDSAQQGFARLLQEDAASATLYGLYLARIESLRINPPPATWDGTFTFTTK
jgi:adenylate cyclase